ncbi:MAG: efflux RND transporter periplasmic adaptor subunit [Cytophagales bacterium]|nr:efflux RND transporter periplasmic adaptor subunit [Cytophagales bacterium]
MEKINIYRPRRHFFEATGHKHFIFLISLLPVIFSCNTDNTSFDTDISVPVSVTEVRTKSIEQYVNTTGSVYAMKEVTLSSEMAGDYTLLKNPGTGRPFALGDIVEAGQKIVRLEDEEYVNNIMIESEKMNLDIAKSEFEKQESLYDKGGVTLRELKNSEREYINAEYSYENAKIQLAKMDVKAPFKGIIVDLPYYTNGTKVSSGSELVTIMNYAQLYLEVNLPEKDIAQIKIGQEAKVTNYTLPNDTLTGKITQLSPAIDPSARTFKGLVVINNPGLLLRPGMFVRADIVVARNDSTIVIPKEIILSKQRGKTVFVVERGTASERIVSTGLESATEIEILKGLKKDERLIVAGFETLRNRSKVKVIR